MESYRPHAVPAREYRDANGRVIPYGERWGMEPAPGDAYSVSAHPERFAPIADVARGLIAYLERAYDVTVTEDLAIAAAVNYPREDAVAAVRVAPRLADAAAVSFVFTGYPSVLVAAGEHFSAVFPPCGCDACDESVEAQARDLEEVVFGIVAGGLVESVRRWTNLVAGVPVPGKRGFAFSLTMDGGSRSGGGLPSGNDRAGQRAALRRIKSRGAKPWAAWGPRG
ncbi:DUF6226 family protein [Demequina lutea]|uniref:Uncharacterized protein n=1 Tax=Demequina lutea TaxID=431489 RepID=A0A7Y9Z8X9_9MICO|nr:DUF6226 family protein [Demequina lutea]NYI41002.1 hypothetical protein [Demequina lutea]